MTVVVGITLCVVDTYQDTGLSCRIRAGEGDGLGVGERAAVCDVDLGTGKVELSLSLLRGAVEGDQFYAEEVVARWNARGQVEVGPSSVADHAVDCPFPGAIVVSIFSDLEPLEVARAGRGCVINFGEVRHHGSCINRLVLEVSRDAEDIIPLCDEAIGLSGSLAN